STALPFSATFSCEFGTSPRIVNHNLKGDGPRCAKTTETGMSMIVLWPFLKRRQWWLPLRSTSVGCQKYVKESQKNTEYRTAEHYETCWQRCIRCRSINRAVQILITGRSRRVCRLGKT